MTEKSLAAPAATSEPECCGSCTAFAAPPARTDKERESLYRGGVDPDKGVCALMPTPVTKHIYDWCRQHQRRSPEAPGRMRAS